METRNEVVAARVTNGERTQIEVAASLRDLSRSEYLRDAAVRAATRDLGAHGGATGDPGCPGCRQPRANPYVAHTSPPGAEGRG